MPDVAPIDVPLLGKPVWLVGVSDGTQRYWAAVLEDGVIQGFRQMGSEFSPTKIEPGRLSAGTPPLLLDSGEPHILAMPPEQFSSLTHPVILPASRTIAALAANNDLVLLDNQLNEIDRLTLNALPDARLLVDENERILLIADPTEEYAHGVLGDAVEATSVKLIATSPTLNIIEEIVLPQGSVIEGISPIWTDLTGDGQREIIVTTSDSNQGAQIMIFSETGDIIAAGPPTGQPYRWRHQIAAAPFGPDGEIELAEVLTPHLGGITGFYRLDRPDLSLVDHLGGCTSHILGSRNLDMAATGDFDDDGQVELLLPTQHFRQLCGVRRTSSGAEIAWTVPTGGTLSTNIAAVTDPDGSISIGVGVEEGYFRIWAP